MSDERSGVLASAAWTAAIAGRADPSRYRRGKEYLREQAVTSLLVRPGIITAEVLGTRAEPYLVSITVPGGVFQRSAGLSMPAASSLRFTCSCPDWEAPCKHAVAVALAFAERLRLAPHLLAELADPDAEQAPEPSAPERSRGHLRLVTEERPAALDPAVAEFLSVPEESDDVPALPGLEPPATVTLTIGRLELGAIVADAVHWLSVAQRQYR